MYKIVKKDGWWKEVWCRKRKIGKINVWSTRGIDWVDEID